MYKVFFKSAALLVILSNSSLNAMEKAPRGKSSYPSQDGFVRDDMYLKKCPSAERMNLSFRARYIDRFVDLTVGGTMRIPLSEDDFRHNVGDKYLLWYLIENNGPLSHENSTGSKFELQNEEKIGTTVICTYNLVQPEMQERVLVISNHPLEPIDNTPTHNEPTKKKGIYDKMKDKMNDKFNK